MGTNVRLAVVMDPIERIKYRQGHDAGDAAGRAGARLDAALPRAGATCGCATAWPRAGRGRCRSRPIRSTGTRSASRRWSRWARST